jgi:flavin-dependent dehydrogenase
MPGIFNASVLVVGGGPVGLTLAMDLASRGIDTIVVETRAAGELPSVKCNSGVGAFDGGVSPPRHRPENSRDRAATGVPQ